MNFTKSPNSIGLLGDLLIEGHNVTMNGTFAFAFKLLTLQSTTLIKDVIGSRNLTNVELDGMLRSPVYIDGFMVFTNGGTKVSCKMQMWRQAGIYIYSFMVGFIFMGVKLWVLLFHTFLWVLIYIGFEFSDKEFF